MEKINRLRRLLLKGTGIIGGAVAIKAAHADHTDTHFEDESEHKVVYQCNKGEIDYYEHILFSVGELIRKHGDNVEIVVSAFGPGIHLLGRRPGRPVPGILQERASSLSQYGVRFHACGNTMNTLQWTEEDLLDFAKIVPIGAEDLMTLQKKGFAYISW